MVTLVSETVSYDLGKNLFIVLKLKNKLFKEASLQLGSDDCIINFYTREELVTFIKNIADFNKIAKF